MVMTRCLLFMGAAARRGGGRAGGGSRAAAGAAAVSPSASTSTAPQHNQATQQVTAPASQRPTLCTRLHGMPSMATAVGSALEPAATAGRTPSAPAGAGADANHASVCITVALRVEVGWPASMEEG